MLFVAVVVKPAMSNFSIFMFYLKKHLPKLSYEF